VWRSRATERENGPPACKALLGWGGYANGLIPTAALMPIGGGHRLEPQAAIAFQGIRAAAAADGLGLALTDSYRSLEAQVSLRHRKGAIVATATPGMSVHGWGRAIDIDLESEPRLRDWLERNAQRFGWVNPAWAQRSGFSFEPWHYEFVGALRNGCAGASGTHLVITAGTPGRTLPSDPPPSLHAVAGAAPALQSALPVRKTAQGSAIAAGAPTAALTTPVSGRHGAWPLAAVLLWSPVAAGFMRRWPST
jgi:hypothetical protein